MGPWDDDLPAVDGVDHAPDQVMRRRVLEDAGWRIWEDSHGTWHAERGGDHAEKPLLQFLLNDLQARPLLN